MNNNQFFTIKGSLKKKKQYLLNAAFIKMEDSMYEEQEQKKTRNKFQTKNSNNYF